MGKSGMGAEEKIMQGECPLDVEEREAFERYLKCGIYKELHARGLLSDTELDELISLMTGDGRNKSP